MKILIACEFSGIVREAFRARGHDAISCDLLPTEIPGPHLQQDVLGVLDQGWDMMIAHPPCTYLSASGLHWNTKRPERIALTNQALDFVRTLLNAPIPKIALENPIGCISSQIRKPDQIIQPWWFGEDASKKTCLWLKDLPLLQKTNPLIKKLYANQTPTGQNKVGETANRWKERSRTYVLVGAAMANQWG